MSNARLDQWPEDQWPLSILTAEDAKYWQKPFADEAPATRPVAALRPRVGTTAQERRKMRVQRRVRLFCMALAYCGVTVAAMFGGWVLVVVMVAGFDAFGG